MRALRITAVTLLATVLGVACGTPGGGDNSETIQLISAAAVANNQAGTAKVSMDMTMTVAEQSVNMAAEGEMDIDAELVEMTMSMTPTGSTSGTPPMDDIELVGSGLKVYFRYPPEIAGSMPGKKPWAMIDMQALGESQGMDIGAMSQLGGGNDPSQILQFLSGVSGTVETVGEEEVRGVNTTHYRADIDLDKAAEQAPKELRDGVRMSVEAMKAQLGATSLPMDVWIGEDGYVHRMGMKIETGEDAPQRFTMDMTMEFYDFGSPVSITVPDASQVYDMTDMMTGMGAPAP